MAESVAVVISSGTQQALGTALDLLAAAAALEMELHVYFTGEAVGWVGRPDWVSRPDTEASGRSDTDAIRQEVAERLRELKDDTTVTVYACSGAMKAHGITRENLTSEVDMPAGFAYFLEVASKASVALNF